VKDTLDVSEKLSAVRGQIEQQQAEFAALSKQTETVAIQITLGTGVEARIFGLDWRPLYQAKFGTTRWIGRGGELRLDDNRGLVFAADCGALADASGRWRHHLEAFALGGQGVVRVEKDGNPRAGIEPTAPSALQAGRCRCFRFGLLAAEDAGNAAHDPPQRKLPVGGKEYLPGAAAAIKPAL